MPRGRHRHSPPLHRLLPPSAIAGVSAVCALGPWVFTEAVLLRGLAAVAAATAVTSAVVMRRWDTQAGKQVADLTRARASDDWRHEERVAELESDLDESRELRGKLEQRLRAKRAELAKLRNEHASLLRRYATAETERATALEGRRLLEIEATTPARAALPPAPVPRQAEPERSEVAEERAEAAEEGTEAAEAEHAREEEHAREDEAKTLAVFSPEGSRLFLRANAALNRLTEDSAEEPAGKAGVTTAEKPETPGNPEGPDGPGGPGERPADEASEDEAQGKSEAADEHERAAAAPETTEQPEPAATEEHSAASPEEHSAEEAPAPAADAPAAPAARSAEVLPAPRPAAALPVRQTRGHFTVPTAVAVVPGAPARRQAVQGGFDFFGTQKSESAALEAVQNEDLADVVGQEALDLHKAEAEARFRPADESTRAVGQVIDLTAHDETEQIDVQRLRSAVS
ncbi:hypothetical protein [Streptomyces sp. NPDC058739]|uniref:hypothetical protein n=1 Tax=Streptomyces sp. NPDC058739 TaxID=3346618 RepID=UPI0036C11A5D